MSGDDGRDATDAAIAAVEEQFGALFNRVRASWKDGAEQVHPELQPIGFKILSTLVRGGPTHATALTESLATDKSVISRQVRMLEAMGLVESSPDEKDGRARILAATPSAVEKVIAVRANNRAEFYENLRSWPDADISTFAELLGRLTR